MQREEGNADWPTTLRFSRRLGEGRRDADYATAIEGPHERPAPQLQPMNGMVRRLLGMVGRLVARRSDARSGSLRIRS
jgi:hypothetical protein